MIGLKFLRCWAVWERLGQEFCREIRQRIKGGALQGVYLGEDARVKIPCEILSTGEVKPWVILPQLGQPHWFQLSLAVPGPRGWVVLVGEGKRVTPRFNQKLEKWLIVFRNGTVVRFHGRKLVADYLAVVRQGARYQLLQKERVAIDVPHFVRDKEGLREFLRGEVTEELLEVAVELFEPDRISNPQWEKGLENVLRSSTPRPRMNPPQPQQPSPHSQPFLPDPVPVEVPSDREQKKVKVDVEKKVEKRRGKKLPLRAEDDVERNPRGMSLRDFREEN
ncbi:MAG: hypothetical protein N2692_00320 [Patescibacteria group bacterium]|nr:hypothetical protein [Patescibacteria group bacterium]